MLFKIKIEDNEVLVKDFVYNLNVETKNTLEIMGVWHGSKDYEYLVKLMGKEVSIDLLTPDDKVFAKLSGVVLNKMIYHLVEEDVDIEGVFQEYDENTDNMGETY